MFARVRKSLYLSGEMNNRLISIDLLRGLTVLLMIFVNNGAGDSIFPLLRHAQWNGMTLADLVFPSFLFIIGMSTWLSLRKFGFRWSRAVAAKVVRRAVLLFAIGLAINWLDMALGGRPLDFAHLRLWGVMQRIALCYLLTAALALSARRWFVPIIMVGLIGYAALLLLCGGYDYDAATNLLAQADLHVVGYDHLYHKSPVDPEGLVSTLSAMVHTMMGFVVMQQLSTKPSLKGKMLFLGLYGLLMLVVGLALTEWLPLNKRVWSPTYVLTTIGLSMLVLCALTALIDRRQLDARHKVLVLPLATGMNPLALYVGSEVVAIAVGAWGIKDAAFRALHVLIPDASWAGFAYALLFTAIFALIGLVMLRRQVFIKL